MLRLARMESKAERLLMKAFYNNNFNKLIIIRKWMKSKKVKKRICKAKMSQTKS